MGVVAPVRQPDVGIDTGAVVQDVEEDDDEGKHRSHSFQVRHKDRELHLIMKRQNTFISENYIS